MELTNNSPQMTCSIVKKYVFKTSPFTLIDIGCSGGISPIWRVFKDQLRAYGIDPQKQECDRLSQAEFNSNVSYHSFFIGLPEEHTYNQSRIANEEQEQYYNPWDRLSSFSYPEIVNKYASQANPIGEDLTTNKISLADFISQENISDIDFIKIDTDGYDLEVLLSAGNLETSHNVLGYMIETSFTGGASETTNNFQNIDRLMRQKGFVIFNLDINKYSRADLPSPFRFNILSQTYSGQPLWGDVIYLRDPSSPNYLSIWQQQLNPEKLLKTACLFEIFGLADCAAELLLTHQEMLSPIVDINTLLDQLTPKVSGRKVSYQNYMDMFLTNTEIFFPPNTLIDRHLSNEHSAPFICNIFKQVTHLLSFEGLIIYGAGTIANSMIPWLKDKIAFIVDIDPQKHGCQIEGVTIYPIEKILKYQQLPIIITVINQDYKISETLSAYGNRKLIFINNF